MFLSPDISPKCHPNQGQHWLIPSLRTTEHPIEGKETNERRIFGSLNELGASEKELRDHSLPNESPEKFHLFLSFVDSQVPKKEKSPCWDSWNESTEDHSSKK